MDSKMLTIFFLAILLHRSDVYGFGVLVTSDRFPYQASLRFYYNDAHHCSGSIIGNNFLLTAGHCVCCYIKYYMLYVVVGANSFIDEGFNYSIQKSICHEDFNFRYLKNDIALLKLGEDFYFNKRVSRIPLIDFKMPKTGILLMSVWGYRKNYIIKPMNFRVLLAALIDLETCASLFPGKMVDNTNICTITTDKGACIGDSGGPVVYKGYLAGIISFGKDCHLGFPNVHTNLSAYNDWIMDQVFLESSLELD